MIEALVKYWKLATGTIFVILALVSGFGNFDSRYAKAGEIKTLKAEQKAGFKSLGKEIVVLLKEERLERLESKYSDLRVDQRRYPDDRFIQEDINHVQDQINTLQLSIDNLKAGQ